jgi:hypothetical protein
METRRRTAGNVTMQMGLPCVVGNGLSLPCVFPGKPVPVWEHQVVRGLESPDALPQAGIQKLHYPAESQCTHAVRRGPIHRRLWIGIRVARLWLGTRALPRSTEPHVVDIVL